MSTQAFLYTLLLLLSLVTVLKGQSCDLPVPSLDFIRFWLYAKEQTDSGDSFLMLSNAFYAS